MICLEVIFLFYFVGVMRLPKSAAAATLAASTPRCSTTVMVPSGSVVVVVVDTQDARLAAAIMARMVFMVVMLGVNRSRDNPAQRA